MRFVPLAPVASRSRAAARWRALRQWTFLLAWCSLGAFAQTPAGLPALTEARPASEAIDIDEQQVFLVRARGPVDGRRIVERVFCDVEGVRSADTVRVIGGARRTQILAAAGIANPENWIVFRCTQTFPQGADVIIRWDASSPTSFAAADYLRFKVRSGEWLELACVRENREAGCNPLAPVGVNVRDRALATADLQRFRLRDAQGKLYAPSAGDDAGGYTVTWRRLPPEAAFTLVVPTGLREDGSDRPLPTPRPISFRTAPYPPLVKFARSFGILERHAEPALPITVRNLEPAGAASTGTAALVRRLRVTGEVEMIRWYARAIGLMSHDRSIDDEESEDGGFGDDPKPGKEEDLRGRSLLKGQQGAQVQPLPKMLPAREFEVVGLPLPEPGLHLVEAESKALGASLLERKGPMFVRALTLVTNLAVHVKAGRDQAFVWVTRLNDAAPVGDAVIRVRDCKGSELAAARTSPEGMARLNYRSPKNVSACPLFYFAAQGDDTSFARGDWTRGIEWWRFNLPSDALDDGDPIGRRVLHTVLPRNLLRPGETVQMKHFARDLKRFGTGAPDVARLPRSAQIVNESSNERTPLALTWSARGNATSELRLPTNARRGRYRVEIGERVTARFTIADFRLPVYKAEVSLPAAHVVGGEPAAFDVRLSFLSGGAASGDQVTARARVDRRFWGGFEQHPEHSFAVEDDDGIRVALGLGGGAGRLPEADEQTIALDASGSARVKFATSAVERPAALIADLEYRDPNGEIYTAQARGTVWPADRMIGIRATDWAMARDALAWEVLTVDVSGRPVAGVPFSVRAVHRSYDVLRRRNVGGFYSYESNTRTQDLGVLCRGISDARGQGQCKASVGVSGEVILLAEVADGRGRKAMASTSLWAAQGDDWMFRFAASDRIDLLPEKKRYLPGERARFQVRMPFREATALITAEREGQVIWSAVTRLSGKAATVEVPIREDWAPNVYVSALLVRGRVGEPAPTALVDLGRPAFKLGIAAVDVDWQRYQLDVRVSTDRSEYQTRDRAQVRIQVTRAGSRQPADRAEVAVFAIDEALLELEPNPTWKLLEAMMRRRDYGVTTASAQMQVIGKRHFGRKALPPGGSGGRGSGTRELFDTLVLWKADLLTDERGEATVEVPLNDALTRFRIVAVAERSDTAGDRFGTGEASIRTTRDLQLFAGLPASVRHGDRYRATVSLRNTSARPLLARVEARQGERVLPVREVRIGAGQTEPVHWEVEAPTAGSEVLWQWDAREQGGSRVDSLRWRQALASATPPRLVASAEAEVKGGQARLRLPAEAVVGAASTPSAEISVALARTYGADSSGIRRYFENYPFACLEQRMTKALGTGREDLWQRIVEDLPDFLSGTGLARYYPGDGAEGYPTLTAFVLAGAHEAGLELPAFLRERMLAGLEAYVAGRLKTDRAWLPNDAVFQQSEKLIALEALSRHGRASRRLVDTVASLPTASAVSPPSRGLPAQVPLARMTAASIIDWLDLLGRLKDLPQANALRAQAIAELRETVRVEDGLVAVARPDQRWYFMRTADYTLARLLRTTLETPELAHLRIPLVRTLNQRMQRSGHLSGTQANLWAAWALERHARSAQAEGRTRVTYGGQTHEIAWSEVAKGTVVSFKPARDAAAPIEIEHSGAGEPWARATLIAALPLTGVQANGIRLSRNYTPVKQQTPGRWRVGDVVAVTLTAQNAAGVGWLAIDDPVPAGATVLGGLSRLATAGAEVKSWQGVRHIERSFTQVRAAYEWAGEGAHRMTYEMRLTTPGRFALPPTFAEAMYAPEVNGQLGNEAFVIEP